MDINVEELMSKGIDLTATWGLRVVGVLVVLFLAWVIAGWASRAALKRFQKSSFDETLGRFFSNLIRYAILAATIIGVLGVFGLETTSFAAVIGAAGLAIGLAFQGTLGNFAAGVMLLVFRPFKVGDVVNTAGQLGIVKAIDLFTTDLATLDNRHIIIPNSAIFGSTIENITHYPTRRVDVSVGTAYGADVEATRKVLETVPPKVSKGLKDPAPQIFLASLGASSVDWQIRIWCNTSDYWDVYQQAIELAKKALEASNIAIPFPQVDVHFDDPALQVLSGQKTG
ncbi:MAG: mechanosensitive ion channel [Myxococcota bacterium]|nr:mechanosensitive ion channel [Myxococcota bacterium]